MSRLRRDPAGAAHTGGTPTRRLRRGLDERLAVSDLQVMHTFIDLATSRKKWLAEVLAPWCQQASLKDLKLADLEWVDIAGKVDPAKTLWFWAWSRFPDLIHQELQGINETRPVSVTLRDGRSFSGYPDARQSQQGELVLIGRDAANPRQQEEHGSFSIDEIVTVHAA